MRFILLLVLKVFLLVPTYAQTEWRSWSSVQLNYKVTEKITVKAKPIVRHFDDLGSYANTSLDLMIVYKINADWSAMALNRYWFIPNQNGREFWFFDLSHKAKIGEKTTLSNRLRYHMAIDWNRTDPDYIRYAPKLSTKVSDKLQSFLAADVFYRVSDATTLSGIRYQMGLNTNLSPKLKLSTQYWRQVRYNEEYPVWDAHVAVVNLIYSI